MHPSRAETVSSAPDLSDLHLRAVASRSQGVLQFFLGNGDVYPDQLRHSGWGRNSDRGRVPDLRQTRRQRERLLPVFITGDLQDDSAGCSLTHLNRLDANLC